MIAAGANAQSVSILATLVNLCLSLICLKAPNLIERIGVTKRGAIVLAFANLLTWLPLVIVFLLAQFGITPTWVAVLWLVNIMPGMLLSFQKDNWLSNMVPEKTLGRYLGQRLAIKSAFFLAAFFSFGFLMDYMGSKNLASFGLVFLVATVMTFMYFYIFTHMYDAKKAAPVPAVEKTPRVQFGLMDYLKDLKRKKLDKFILFTALINSSIGISAPFYAVYMLQEQNFSYLSYTMIISVEFLARIISGPSWGKFADKKGNIQVLKIVSRIVPALPICWLFSTNIFYLAAIQIVSGICWGAFDLSTQSYLYKVAPQITKLRYIVYTRSLMLFSVAMGGLAGSFLIKDIFPIFGSKLLTILMLSGFMRAIIVMFLIPKIIDLAVKYGIPQRAKIDLALTKKETAKHGLFYRVPETEQVNAKANIIEGKVTHKRNPALEQRLMEANAAKKQLELLTETVITGRKRNWAVEAAAKAREQKTELKTSPKKVEQKEPAIEIGDTVRRNWALKQFTEKQSLATEPAEIKPSRRAWFGDEEIFDSYRARVPVLAAAGAGGISLSVEKPVSRGGLFYNSPEWARYKESSLNAVIKEKEAFKAVPKQKHQVFLESSYPWRCTY